MDMEIVPRTLVPYMLAHAYLFWHLYRLRDGHRFWNGRRLALLALPWFLCMGVFPLCYALLPSGSVLRAVWAEAGKLWLPFAFFGVAVFAVADAAALALTALRRITGRRLPLPPWPHRALFLLAALCLYGYGAYEARQLQVVRLELRTAKLPPGTNALRLVFAADLHIGPQAGEAFLEKAVTAIMAQHPDLVLLGGDTLDDARQGTGTDVRILERLRAPLGVFAVFGNHDAFGGHERTAAFLARAGIKLLSDQGAQAGPIAILGLDDPDVTAAKGVPGLDVAAALRSLLRDRFTILLAHRPVVREDAVGLFDVQFSGHTHGGQVVLLRPLMETMYGTATGLTAHTAPQGSSLVYVTAGVGFSKWPIRLFVPPEIVVVDLVRDEEKVSPPAVVTADGDAPRK